MRRSEIIAVITQKFVGWKMRHVVRSEWEQVVAYIETVERERDGLAEELSLCKQMLVDTMRTLADEVERRTAGE